MLPSSRETNELIVMEYFKIYVCPD
jgi:hypothetical protein